MNATETQTAAGATPGAEGNGTNQTQGTKAGAGTPTEPKTLADFQELARASLMQEDAPTAPRRPTETQTEGEATAGNESPDAAAATEAKGTEEAQAAAEAGTENADRTTPTEEAAEEAEPTAEEQAGWTEGEKRIHAALVKERAKNKEARKTNGALAKRLEDLEKLVAKPNPTPADPAAEAAKAREADAAHTPPTATAPSAPHLADCQNFESVERAVQLATTVETLAFRLLGDLGANNRAAVDAALKAEKVTHLNGIPLAEADDAAVRTFLTGAYEGARQTQAQAQPRRQFIAARNQNWHEAAKVIPAINDVKSPEHQQLLQLFRAAPGLRDRADGPMLAVRLMLGDQAMKAKTAGNGATRTNGTNGNGTAPVKPPARKPAPGAPKTSAAALPAANEMAELSKKMEQGTASVADAKRLTKLSLMAG